MENNTQQVDIPIVLDEMDEMAKCCIYTVPEFVKKGKEDCYRPLVISIGPVFYKKDPNLETMQKLKRFYLKCFTEHPDNGYKSLEPYNNYVREHESQIRECYEEQISLTSDEFSQMIVLDAAFLMQLFLFFSDSDDRPSNNTQPPPRLANKLWALFDILPRDLIVQENQLPFFILNGIYDIAFGAVNPRHSFLDLTIGFIQNIYSDIFKPIKSIIISKKITDASSIKHLVHLLWLCNCSPLIERQTRKGHQPFVKIDTARQLSAVGVTFTSIESESLFDITFDKYTGELKIPKLLVYDGSEPLLRNILIFEQFYCYSDSYYFFNYIYFLDQLIDGVKDIEMLRQKGILNNDFGSDQDAADLFNQFGKNLPSAGSNYIYSGDSNNLNDYASKPWNKWKAILWSNYFNHPWAIISLIAAVILLILTILQAITGFLQLHN